MLTKTLFLIVSQSLVAFPKLKRQVLSYDPVVSSPKDFAEGTLFYINQEFSLMYERTTVAPTSSLLLAQSFSVSTKMKLNRFLLLLVLLQKELQSAEKGKD